MDRVQKQVKRDEVLDLLAELSVKDKSKRKHILENRIYYFGNYDEALDAEFPDLKLKGPNTLQAKIIEAWDNPDYKIFTLVGANRIGKTLMGIVLAICAMAGKWLWNGQPMYFNHSKPRKIRYIGQDWEEHIKTVVEKGLLEWWPKERSVETKKNNQGIRAQWVDKESGSELIIMSNKQDSGTHEGWEGDLVIYDEPPKRDIFIANSRGLVDRVGRQVFCMTLLKEAWVHREVIKRMTPEGLPDPVVFNVTGEIYDNVGFGLTMEGVEDFAKTLRPDEREARLHGKPSYLSGLIFPRFDRQLHVKERFKGGIPLDWPVDVAIDWHPSKGWAVLFMATDTLNRKWIINEFFVKANYKWVAEEIVRIIRKGSLRVDEPILIDPLAKSGSQSDIDEETVYDKLENELIRYGYYLMPASKDQNSGIDIINEYLMTESEEPAYFIFRDCPISVKHHEDWMWVDGKPASEGEDMCENAYRIMLRNTQYRAVNRKSGGSQASANWKIA